MATVIDFAASFPSADAVKSAGHDGVVCYVSPARATWMGAKPLTKTAADAYRDAGLGVACVWQYGGADNPDVMRGEAGGRADALAADKTLKAAGLDGHPVFFAVDFNITLQQWNTTAVEYFRGAVAVLGRQRVGAYGHSRLVAWAQEDGVIADLGGGRCLGWVTSSWSNGDHGQAYAVLYQGTHNVPGPSGVQVDINEVLSPQWGQAPITKKKETTVGEYFDEDWSDRFDFGGARSVKDLMRVVVHTTENPAGTPAANVANYQITSRTGSYHVLVDTTGHRLLENTDDWQTWSTGNNAGNVLGLNLSFVAQAAWTRSQWIAQDKMLRAGATVAARWCSLYSIPAVKVDGRSRGMCGHGDLRVWGGTDHTDPGAGFPWDVFARYVSEAMVVEEAGPEVVPAPAPVTAISTDTRTALVLDQMAGPVRDASGAPDWSGWEQLGDRTLVDAVAAIGAHLGITGFIDPKEQS